MSEPLHEPDEPDGPDRSGEGDDPDQGETAEFAERQTADVIRLLDSGSRRRAAGQVDNVIDLGAERAEVPPFRIVVATDFASSSFSAATAPPAVLFAFSQMFRAGEPVNLVFALDHEPNDADAARAQGLLGQLSAKHTRQGLAGISLESFDEVGAQTAFASVIPAGDPHSLVLDLGSALTAMHLLAATIPDPGRLKLALIHQGRLSRRPDHDLRARLASYREVELPRG